MIQESKSSSRGKWYVPAGRVEAGESFWQGAVRECLEESGIEFVPTKLVNVWHHASKSGHWIRFCVTGIVAGGSLKSPEQEDEHSIQAQWFSKEELHEMGDRGELRTLDFLQEVEAFESGNSLPCSKEEALLSARGSSSH